MSDVLDQLYIKFIKERQKTAEGLFERYKGPMIGVVVDTNDPINMHRLKVKIPEMHDWDMADVDVPWARPAAWMGGNNAGSWTSFAIGDLVYVMFERNHPYSIIYFAAADATRRARYVLESVYAKSPSALNVEAEVDETFIENPPKHNDPKYQFYPDYVSKWLPHDRRPMSDGMKTHYGHCLVMKAVGFFPKAHDKPPTAVGTDPCTGANLDVGGAPDRNDPDAKYVLLMSKYGNFFMLSDVGYKWWNEFEGNWDGDGIKRKKERRWERHRCNYYTVAHTEQRYKNRDQRRIELRTRYGHLFEMRDVGWRLGRRYEYDIESTKVLADNRVAYGDEDHELTVVDHRWIKLRSKGGHLFQMYDKGSCPVKDNFVASKLSDNEFGEFMDQECPRAIGTPFGPGFWHERRDARFIRYVTRYGYKLVLDDRGTDNIKAELAPMPYGNGFMVKGRRHGRDGVERGFGIEFNEKNGLNHLILYSPKSKAIEINDEYDYVMMATDTYGADNRFDSDNHISESMMKRADNEFTTKTIMANLDGMGIIDLAGGNNGGRIKRFEPEWQTHHLKLDKNNAYIRLKTHYRPGIPAGIESRCGVVGGNWTEINDHQDRGLWFSQDKRRSVWRSETYNKAPNVEPLLWQTLDEKDKQILIINNGDVTQIYVRGNMEFIAGGEIAFSCGSKFSITAPGGVHVQTGGTGHVLDGAGIGTTGNMYCVSHVGHKPGCYPGPGCGSAAPRGGSPTVPSKRSLDKYKPGGYLLERAADLNSYQLVTRKYVIWNDRDRLSNERCDIDQCDVDQCDHRW